ncbi:formate dehydrogenase subunit gamma [Pseudooceanicola algae]|uniref:NADP-reducing hydrogenase subunit HndA n=1 Tax=Pseudooceanicola algae TaxID=1537215 RepID=A0A418SER9_9RHOB|nr:formate dehydrogenase subunit gamma [Pseudooceanicola algae]QPM90211.1 NADP-reducing hydrogenase subunit HndA [Pseudooceanicola algae]
MHPQPSAEDIRELLGRHLHLEGPLLPILHDIQNSFGFVPQTAVPVIAEALNLSVAEVTGVIGFYHDFRKAPAGRHVLKLCRAEACQSMGSEVLAARILSLLGVDWHGTTTDGRITVEPVYCLGLCACAPAAMLDGRVHGALTEARAQRLVEALA